MMKKYMRGMSRLLAFVLAFAITFQCVNVEMVLAQGEALSEIVNELIPENNENEELLDNQEDDTGDNEEELVEEDEEDLSDEDEDVSDETGEEDPDSETGKDESEDKEDEDEPLEEDELEDEKEKLPELILDDSESTGKSYESYSLDTTNFSPEAMSLVYSGMSYSQLSDYEKFVLRDQVSVRPESMRDCENYGYSIEASIPIARLMQQLDLSIGGVHQMIENYGGIDGAVCEANEFMEILIVQFSKISDEAKAELISYIAAGYTTKHVVLTYNLSLALDMTMSELMAEEQVFTVENITVLDASENEKEKPEEDKLPLAPEQLIPDGNISDEKDGQSSEEKNNQGDLDNHEDEENPAGAENSENNENPDNTEDSGSSDEESELSGNDDLSDIFGNGSEIENTGVIHSEFQPISGGYYTPSESLNESFGENQDQDESEVGNNEEDADENENNTPELDGIEEDESQSEDESNEENSEDKDEKEDDSDGSVPIEIPELNPEKQELLPKETEKPEEIEEVVLSEFDIKLIIDLANKYQVHPDIITNFVIEKGIKPQDIRKMAEAIAREMGIKVEEEFSMVAMATMAAGATVYPDFQLSWQYPTSPFSYKGLYSEDININTGALVYTDHIVSLSGKAGLDLNLAFVYDSSEATDDYYAGSLSSTCIYYNGQIYEDRQDFLLTKHYGPIKSDTMNNGYNKRNVATGWHLNTTRIFTDITTMIGGLFNIPNPYIFMKLSDGRTFQIKSTYGVDTVEIVGYKLNDLKMKTDNYSTYAGSSYCLTYADGTKEYIGQNLIAKTDKYGNEITYVESGNTLTVTDTNNRVVTINLPGVNGNAMSVALPDGKTITYSLPDIGAYGMRFRTLASKTDQMGRKTTFEYERGEYIPDFFSRNPQKTELLDYYESTNASLGFPYHNPRNFGTYFQFRTAYNSRGEELIGVELNSYNNNIENTTVFCSSNERVTDVGSCSYINLTKVTYPTGMFTQYIYGKARTSLHAMGSTDYYYIKERYDYADGKMYNDVKYTVGLNGDTKNNYGGMSINERFISELPASYRYYMQEDAQGIKTLYCFNNKHQLVEKTVTVGTETIEQCAYTYDTNDLMATSSTTVKKGGNSYTVKESFEHDNYGNLSKYWSSLAEGTKNNQYMTAYTYDYTYNQLLSKTYNQDVFTAIVETYTLDSSKKHPVRYTQTSRGVQSQRVDFTVNNYGAVTKQRTYTSSSDYIDEDYTYQNNTYILSKTSGGFSERYTYDVMGNVKTLTDRNNKVYTNTYDDLGRLIRTVNPDSTYTQSAYDDAGNTITARNEAGNSLKYLYNAMGLLTSIVDVQTGNVLTSATYDNRMNLLSETDPKGTVTTYTYDNRNRPLSKTVGTYKETYEYQDAFGNAGDKLTKTIQGDAKAPSIKTAVYADKYGRVEYESAFNGSTELKTSYSYDYVGNVLRVTDPKSNVTHYSYTYESTGPVVTTTNALSKQVVEKLDYVGRKISTTDPQGSTSLYYYNAQGLLSESRVPFEGSYYQSKQYTYDGNGNQLSVAVSANKPGEVLKELRTAYEYNNRNMLIKVSSAGDVVEYAYDPMGNKTQVTTAGGSQITSYEYDHFNRVTRLTDAMNRSERYEYDKNGNMVMKFDRNGTEFNYTYDNLNRLTDTRAKVGPTLQPQFMKTTYSSNGLIITNENENYKTTNTYDSLGRITEQIATDGSRRAYTYDNVGNRATFNLYQNNALVLNQSYNYDALNRLINVSKSGVQQASYTYSNNGYRMSMSRPNGVTTSYTYNLAGLITSMNNKKGSQTLSGYTYSYYLDGNQASKTDHTGRITTYAYDDLSRLTAETETGNNSSTDKTYTYDPAGNRASMTSTTNGNVEYTAYSYDLNNRLIRQHMSNAATGAQMMSSFTYDGNGNTLMKMSSGINPKITSLHPSLSLTLIATDEEEGSYDHFGTELQGKTHNIVDEPQSLNSMVLGNNIKKIDSYYTTEYTYDVFNRLTAIAEPGLKAQYTYKADNMRISKTVNGETTNHIWDGSNIVAETNGAGSIIDAYVRGGGLVSSNLHGFYLFNGHGDVVQLADATGNVLRDYDFDAFGVENGVDEEDTNPWRYCGEYTDLETNNVYLRNRYYSPTTGRFLTEDSVLGVSDKMPNGQRIANPRSLNLYTYCYNSPITYVDPSGNISAAVFGGGVATFGGSTVSSIVGGLLANLALLGGAAWTGDKIGSAVGNSISTTISNSSSSASKSQGVAVPAPSPGWQDKTKTEQKKTGEKSESTTLSVPGISVRTNDDNQTYIYRWGDNSYQQLTTNFDHDNYSGLSYTTKYRPGKECTMTTIEAVNNTGVLRAYIDNPKTGHVAVVPTDIAELQGWLESWENADANPHPYTLILHKISIYLPSGVE